FFRARTTWAMLTRSWGSCSTTMMLMVPTTSRRHSAFRTPHSALSLSDQLQHTHPCYILPVAPHEHPAVAAAPDQLPGAARAARQHLVHEQVEPQPPADVRALPPPPLPPFRPGDAECHAIPALGAQPGAAHAVGIGRRIAGCPHPERSRVRLGHNEESDTPVPTPPSLVPRDVHLQTV